MASILDEPYLLGKKKKKEKERKEKKLCLFSQNIGVVFCYHFEIKDVPDIESIYIIQNISFMWNLHIWLNIIYIFFFLRELNI